MRIAWVNDRFASTIPRKLVATVMTIVRIGLLNLPLSTLFAPCTLLAQEKQTANSVSQISVRLSIPRKTFTVEELVTVTVRIVNVGSKPVLVPNLLSTSRNSPSHIEFELRDAHGRASPSLEMIADTFLAREAASPATALLGSWLLLNPGYSLVIDINLDKQLFTFLGKPGNYKLSGRYFSSGLFYPPTYRQIGLTDEDVKSLPFQSWSGNISTNTLALEIVPAKPH